MRRKISYTGSSSLYISRQDESWLEDMAKDGNILNRITKGFAVFEKEKPKVRQYGIVILDIKPNEEELLECDMLGWNYVTKRGTSYIFETSENVSKEMLYEFFDQDTVLECLIIQNKKNIKMWKHSFIMVGMICLLKLLILICTQQILLLLEPSFYLIDCCVAYSLFSIYRAKYNVKKLQGDKQKLTRSKNILIHSILKAGMIGTTILAIGMPIAKIISHKDYSLPLETKSLPCISLKNIESPDTVKRQTYYDDQDIDFSNSVSYAWDLLVPIQYEIREKGIAISQEPKQEDIEVTMVTRFYNLKTRVFVKAFTKNIAEKYSREPFEKFTQVKQQKIDGIYILEYGNTKEVIGYHEKSIMYMQYDGDETFQKLITLMQEKLLAQR
ncbi:MAG: DUF2812 domain-containing protein [Cellulosilyticaceae bacterium]